MNTPITLSSILEAGLVNPPPEDPIVYLKREGPTFLFDLGLADFRKPMLKNVEKVFISHTHMDHFSGFASMLKFLYGRRKRVDIYGHEGIASQVKNQINSYTWDRAEPDDLEITVTELINKKQKSFSFSIKGNMEGISTGETKNNNIAFRGEDFSVKYIILNHGIPSLGYCFEEDKKFRINKDILESSGLGEGPWLKELLETKKKGGGTFKIGNKLKKVDEFKDFVRIEKGKKIVYFIDFLFENKRLNEFVSFAYEADLFYCEGYFLSQDRELAKKKYHLLAKESGIIAREAKVKKLINPHFSARYTEEEVKRLINEAEKELRK